MRLSCLTITRSPGPGSRMTVRLPPSSVRVVRPDFSSSRRGVGAAADGVLSDRGGGAEMIAGGGEPGAGDPFVGGETGSPFGEAVGPLSDGRG